MEEKIYVHIQLERQLKENLKNEAKAKGLSLNSYVRMILLSRKK